MDNSITSQQRYINRILLVRKNYIDPKRIAMCHPRKSDAFILILNGSCKYRFSDGHRLEAMRGDILYLAKDSQYEMQVMERYDFIYADFYFDGDPNRQSDVFKPKDGQETENTFFRLLRKYAEEPDALAEIMELLYRIYQIVVRSRITTYLSNDVRAKIEKARAFISMNLTDPDLSVYALTKKIGMSEAYFRALFKELCGISPSRFITDQRLIRAKELLELRYLSLEEIARQCGFSSASYFCRVFKKSLGITAMEYCRMSQNDST